MTQSPTLIDLAGEPGAPPSSMPNVGKKRGRVDESPAFDDSDFRDATEGLPIDKSPDQVRRMIRRLIDNGGMKVGEFCDKLGVSNKSYNNFLRQSGSTKGLNSDCYYNAWAFFKYRDMHGIKLPTASSGNKKQKADDVGKTGSQAASKDKAATAADLADIHLVGEEDDTVEIYDTCDEIRKKLDAHLKKPGVTQAQLCRDLSAMYTAPTKIAPGQLSNFRSKKGPNVGNTANIFYAAYCFFEKLRLKEGKPKSKHREEMEAIWSQRGGFDTETRHDVSYICVGSSRPYVDKYGLVQML
ncbi:calcineurin is a calcium-dependent [Diplodia corticola]|uniref:Calcineurin is a calcium-dependent n=1 Tax=Diplodia corticola TaxID=236234 RepID=A0A1J9QTJ6_9PEZI|nr:calcineurin is a calcium-dependent [Diplodia corticola]OJD31760.1 calcineurin is a calcium-dependent [Diplodia corticola]